MEQLLYEIPELFSIDPIPIYVCYRSNKLALDSRFNLTFAWTNQIDNNLTRASVDKHDHSKERPWYEVRLTFSLTRYCE